MLEELSQSTMDTILEYAGPDSDGSITLVNLTHLGGALATPPATPNAVRRDVAFALLALTVVPPGAPDPQQDAGSVLIGRLGGIRHPSYLAPSDASVARVQDQPMPSPVEFRDVLLAQLRLMLGAGPPGR